MGRRKHKKFFIHLVSDATGTTLLGLSRAVLSQFEGIEPTQKFWPLIRTQRQLERVMKRIEESPGPVVSTFVNDDMRAILKAHCDHLGVPCIAVLDPIIHSLSAYIGLPPKGVPGLQHAMDEDYFKRVAAIEFALRFDDGRGAKGLKEADVILVGVSRTSKTPTCVYLARRGIKAANIPLVPDVPVPEEHFHLKRPLYVGLTSSPERLKHLRHSRLKTDKANEKILHHNMYLDEDKIEEETRKARRLFADHNWPVIDVTKRSVEETAAEIMSLLQTRRDAKKSEKREDHDKS